MSPKPIHVTSEIGSLQRVVLHRPGKELANMKADEFEKCWIHDAFYLDYAQKEHDEFARLLREHGAEVLYMEDLLAEAMDQHPEARTAFLDEYMSQAPVPDPELALLVRQKLDAIRDNRALVDAALAGLRLKDLELASGPTTLSRLEGDGVALDDFVVYSMPSSYFSRDPIASISNGVALHRMYYNQRNREVPFYKTFLTYHDDFAGTPFWYDNHSAAHIEGGDVLNINTATLAVGISQRTEAAAIDVMANHMFWSHGEDCPIDEIYAFNIPVSRAFMHLDTVFTQIDVDKFTIHPAIMGTLQVFKMTPGAHENEVKIEEMNDTLEHTLAKILGLDQVTLIPCGGGDPIAAAREQWNDGSNTLCVRPGTICVYQRNNVTNDILYKAGMELLVIPSAELSRGRGGPRCMSMPFWREDL